MMWNPRQRILAATSLALIAAALVAGNANAERPDDRAGMLGVGAASTSRATQSAISASLDRAGSARKNPYGILGPSPARVQRVDQTRVPNPYGTLGPSPQRVQQLTSTRPVARSTTAPNRPDDRGTAHGPGVYFTAPPIPTMSVSADAFRWRDASAGAAAALVAILLAAGLRASIRQRGRTAVS